MAFWMFWLMAAVILFVVEMFIGTVYLLVLSAALVGAALAAFFGVGLAGCIFITAFLAALGSLYVYFMRKKRSLKQDVSCDNDLDLGQVVQIESRLQHNLWRVHYRGALWTARSVLTQDFQAGETARICGKDGIVLLIERMA